MHPWIYKIKRKKKETTFFQNKIIPANESAKLPRIEHVQQIDLFSNDERIQTF